MMTRYVIFFLIVLCLTVIDGFMRTSRAGLPMPTAQTNRPLDIPLAFTSFDATFKLRGANKGFLSMSLAERTKSPETTYPLSRHPQLVRGRLENGLTYVVLPNNVPEGRFEAHLEILSGSANELETQQGMAHLLEHVAYMGSPKRQIISGSGARTNAYTDFHHTVYYASCPTISPSGFWKTPMLPMAFDALLDVMTTKVDDERMEKERAAVLSEASMVNKMEYRVECQVLTALHSENRISIRLPIGKEDMIKKWTKEEVQLYHSLHYRPDNSVLYVVGDLEPEYAIKTIKEKFSSLKPKIDYKKVLLASGEFPAISMQELNPHFPPVVHRWSCKEDLTKKYVVPALIKPSEIPKQETLYDMIPKPRVYNHELLQAFSFHLFAKRPIEPITTFETLKRELMRKMCTSAMAIRFNVLQRQDPLFTFIDFNQLNWPREGCAVCSLDLTTDALSWRDGIKAAIMEIRRLGVYGLTEGELTRYKASVLLEAQQQAAQADQNANEEVLRVLMEAEANGHTYMHPYQSFEETERALNSITMEELNTISRELCEHLSHMNIDSEVHPAAIVACVPALDRTGAKFTITDEDVAAAIKEGLNAPIEPFEDTAVPLTLINADELDRKKSDVKPAWVPLRPEVAVDAKKYEGSAISQRMLSNGLRVNMISTQGEPQKIAVRLYVPGGRMLESKDKPGALVLGTKTMQEGGAFSKMSREEVELFCIDHMVSVEILAEDDALIFDFESVVLPNANIAPGHVSGFEAVMQVLHIILTDFKFEDDAFERAKQGCFEKYDMTTKGLETACQERIIQSLSGNDLRMLVPDHNTIENLDLSTVKLSVLDQLGSEAVEVSISGDVSLHEIEEMALNYLGTVPNRPVEKLRALSSPSFTCKVAGGKKPLVVYFQDSEERAMGYLAGPCANNWGVFANGKSLSFVISSRAGNNKEDKRRNHPLFGHAILQIFQEIANRRLFSVVREERQLTYDASFQLHNFDSVQGGWYTVSVTSSPSQVKAAVEACKDALSSMKGPHGIGGDSLQSVKRTLINRFRGESLTNKFWVKTLSGTQIESIPLKSIRYVFEYEQILNGVTLEDIRLLIDELNFCDENYVACIGITSPNPVTI